MLLLVTRREKNKKRARSEDKSMKINTVSSSLIYRCFHLKSTMSQTSISSFFRSPLAQKSRDGVNTSDGEPACKKAKLCVQADDLKDSSKSLSEIERDRMAENKFSAKMKLMGNKTNGLVVNIGPTWFRALELEFSKEYFVKMSKFVAAERKKGTVYPPPEQVFTWTTACPIRSVKVVIIGQDPYHGPRQAHGLCFSVLPGVKPPPSLENMYTELKSDIDGFEHPGHGMLIGWAQQGVLLLNACLTVRAGQANSHAGQGWEQFTDAVIQWLNSNLTGLVFMLWGAYAQKKGACIDKKKHHVLTAVHPSPLSAHRGFFGCKHFSRCNELLKKDGQPPIDWTRLPRKLE